MPLALSLASFTVCLGALTLGLFVLVRERQPTWMTAAYVLAALCEAVWAFTCTLLIQTSNPDKARSLSCAGSIGWTIGIAAAFLFCYALYCDVVGEQPSRLIIGFVSLSGIAFWISALTGCLLANHFVRIPAGWFQTADLASPWVLFYLIWLAFLCTLLVVFSLIATKKAALNRSRRLVRFVLFPSALFSILVFLANLILPFLGLAAIPPIAHLIFGLLIIVTGLAILRYRMFRIEPGFVIERLFFEVTDLVILTDMRGLIRRSNQANLFKETLAGKPIQAVLPDLELRGQAIYRAPQKRVFETDLLLSTGERIPVRGSLSVVADIHDDPVGYFFLLHDLRAVRELAQYAADLRESYEKLEMLSKTDHLTGIWNRARFNEVLQTEFERYRRYSEPFTVLLFDIDKFKLVNDTLGHLAGDHVLKKVTARVQQEIRATDVFARWGGDEFAVLCPHLDGPGAAQVAERIRRAVASASEEQFAISASIGMASVTRQDNLTELLERADAAIYTAKQQGGNCFVLG
jgi:diguanylate cyclase (GGDEF)-like protein